MATDKNYTMKIVDLDGAFDGRMAEYFSKNRKKFTEEEWENFFAESYIKFSNTRIESLNATPNEYYLKMSQEELMLSLQLRFEKNVPIDGFLRRTLDEDKNRPVLCSLLDGTNREAAFAVEILGGDRTLYEAYLELLCREDSDGLHALLIDVLKEDADFLCDDLLQLYSQGIACDCVADIVSYCAVPREEVFFLLLDEFLKSTSNLEQATMRLARYGDERALPYIKERAERAETGYLDFRSLRLAAEALGGKVKERDFSSDEEYIALAQEEVRQREERENSDGK